MRTRRVAALWLPGFPLQAIGRDNPHLLTRPVAVSDGAQIVARNRLATEAGVAVGMRVAEALTHAPDLLLLPYDAQRVQALWDIVLDQLDTLGSLVEDAGPGHALVDLTGAGHSERTLVRRTLDTLRALLDLGARAAVADGPFAASVAARRARGEREGRVLPRGQSAASLAPLPVSLLPLPGKLLANLERGQCDRCGGSGESLAQRVGAGWRALSVGTAIAADTG